MSEEINNVKDVRELVEKYYTPEKIDLSDNAEAMILPEGLEIHSLKKFYDEFRQAPESNKGNTELTTVDSFNEFINRFKTVNSAAFYSKDRQSVLCIFDYSTKEQPLFERFSASYSFPLSKSWKTWTSQNKNGMNQVSFVEFIENNIADLCEPLGDEEISDDLRELKLRLGGNFATVAKMVELSRGIKINSEEKAVSKINNTTGEVTIEYQTEHKDGSAQLKIPNLFMIMVQVFENGKYYKLPCHLRYRLRDGNIAWSYEIINADKAIDHAVNEELVKIKEVTSLPLFYGRKGGC